MALLTIKLMVHSMTQNEDYLRKTAASVGTMVTAARCSPRVGGVRNCTSVCTKIADQCTITVVG